ncbi:MAG: hypothetical protein KC940_08965 [Candidatus Omnitrophica bacterium]|nr:hypothetical protein [Candidatus Omnitrophota bacterium]MCA9425421.1 hypothetical protein [Candidatus Omnitrophota bacterium]MCA9430623.1 hypothetical protein [Candidatus Omnitrophota bacterium]MCA9434895.1 hypothetical protein [Candidatus Omnitrophota bacterium]MCA9439627.1 hypothetical protein [Candidatus Omnitrophota bacterium]
MPKPTCQLNLTLDVPTAERVEEIAFAAHKRPSGAGRDLLLERMKLIEAGWPLEDDETMEFLLKVLSASKPKKDKIRDLVK